MVRIGRLPTKIVEQQPVSTPFDLLDVDIGGVVVKARPYDMVISSDSMQHPAKASTSCPHCGHGVDVDVRQDILLIGGMQHAMCLNCDAGVVKPIEALRDPFKNPIASGALSRSEIDPLYVMPASSSLTAAEKVQERLAAQRNVDDDFVKTLLEAEPGVDGV